VFYFLGTPCQRLFVAGVVLSFSGSVCAEPATFLGKSCLHHRQGNCILTAGCAACTTLINNLQKLAWRQLRVQHAYHAVPPVSHSIVSAVLLLLCIKWVALHIPCLQ
jgi:hypothetical protein